MFSSWAVVEEKINACHREQLQAAETLERFRERGTYSTWPHEPLLQSLGDTLISVGHKLKRCNQTDSTEPTLPAP